MTRLIPPPKDFAEQFENSVKNLQALVSNSRIVQDFNNAEYETFARQAMEPLGFYIGQVAAKFPEGGNLRAICFNTRRTLNSLSSDLVDSRRNLSSEQQRNPSSLISQRRELLKGIQGLAHFVLDEVPTIPKNDRVRTRASKLMAINPTPTD